MACNGNDYVSNFRDGTLYLMDGGGNTLTVPLEMGDVAISGLSGDMTEVAVYRSRGRTVAVRKTNDLQPSIAFSAMLVGMALDELERRDARIACVTLCVGGGMGTAALIERC